MKKRCIYFLLIPFAILISCSQKDGKTTGKCPYHNSGLEVEKRVSEVQW